jgi:PAS domain S-box-containing protein
MEDRQLRFGRTALFRISVTVLLFAFVAFPLVSQSRESVAEREVSVAVFDGAEPVVFINEEGEAAGIYPDILRRMLRELDYEPVFVTGLSFSEAYAAVVGGEIDLLPGALRTPEREEELAFNEQPFMVSWSQLFVPRTTQVDSVLELTNKRVAVLEGGQNGRAFADLMRSFDIPYQEVPYPDFETAIEAAETGEAEALVGFSTLRWANTDLVPTSVVFAPNAAFLATARGTNSALLSQIDERLAELKPNEHSYYNSILNDWLGHDAEQVLPRWLFYVFGGIAIGAIILLLIAVSFRSTIARVTFQLHQSEVRFRTIFDVAADAVLVYELSSDSNGVAPGSIREVNDSTSDILGYSREQLVGQAVSRLIKEEDLSDFAAAHAQMSGNDPVTVSAHLLTRGGEEISMELKIRSFEAAGAQLATVACRDVTDRVEAEKRLRESLATKEVLLREIHHRVKNNLQVIASLMTIRMNDVDDEQARTILQEMSDRVHALGLLHRLLYQNEDLDAIDLGAYTTALCNQVWSAHILDPEQIRLELCVDPAPVDLDTALPFGLLLNEALTNAIKHAFAATQKGTVTVTVVADSGRIALTVRDNGVGINTASGESHGLGLRMVDLLAGQLGGTAEIRGTDGVEVVVAFPATRATRTA